MVLRLGWNSLDSKGGKAVADSLPLNTTVLELYLQQNGIGDTSGAHIARALEANTALHLLDLSANHLSYQTCLVLDETLQSNKTLELLIMRENPLGSGSSKLLSSATAGSIKHLDVFNCGFILKYNAGYKMFNPKEPDGPYLLDLSKPPDYQVRCRGGCDVCLGHVQCCLPCH